MVDYVKLAATATRMIKKTGRDVDIIKLNRTDSDSSKPWRGNTAPRTSPEQTVTVKATFVQPDSTTQLGLSTVRADGLLKRSDQIMIVAPTTVNLEDFDEVLDGGTRWGIVGVEVLQPGIVRLLYFIGVKR